MISNIYIDLESIPGDNFMREKVAREVKPPASYSKPESIAAWHVEKGPQAALEAQHQLGMHHAYMQIVAISWAIEDETPITHYGENEADLINRFQSSLAMGIANLPNVWSYRFVGHNICGFDLPALWWAHLRNNITYAFLPNPRKVKPWETSACVDTLYQLSGGNTKGYSLANMCKMFCIESAYPEMEGSQVWDLWKQGEHKLVADYCADDVMLVRRLHKRMKGFLA